MDITLTHGYFLDEDPHEREVMKPYPPLGILYISSHLKERGFDVDTFDTTFQRPSDFADYIASTRPPVVGIYSNMMTRRRVLDMIRICKEQGCTVILGGPESANYPEEYLKRGADVVVIGEGELTIEELLPHLARCGPTGMEGIEGIVYDEDNGHLVQTAPRPHIENLDAQPFPDRGAIDMEAYLDAWREHHGRTAVSLITSRGCPYRCRWCSHAVFGYSHRRRSPKNVADEVELIIDQYQPEMLWYADDIFTFPHRGFFGLAEELAERGIRIPFETISREDCLDEGVIQTLADMGCFRLWLGSESGSQRMIDAMDRRVDLERTQRMTRLLQACGIEVGMFIMLGYEGEEIRDIEDTVGHLKAAAPDAFVTTVAYPVKNTPYYKAVEDRIIAPGPWEEHIDRDLTVAGRHSRRFYELASRWMVSEVNFKRQLTGERRDYVRMAKDFVNARVGRIGMLLTRWETETGS